MAGPMTVDSDHLLFYWTDMRFGCFRQVLDDAEHLAIVRGLFASVRYLEAGCPCELRTDCMDCEA